MSLTSFLEGITRSQKARDAAGGLFAAGIRSATIAAGAFLLPLAFSVSPANAQIKAETVSVLPGGYLPLRQQLSRLSKISGYTYTADKDLPNSRLFIAVGSLANFDQSNQQEVRNQLSELLTGPQWQYLWRTEKSAKNEAKIFLLERHAITDADRQTALIKNSSEKLRYLSGLVKDWPAQREAVMQEDVDTGNYLNAAFVRNGISLLNSLPWDLVTQALSGQTVELSASSLSDEQIGFLYEYQGRNMVNSKDELRTQGTIRLRPVNPSGTQPTGATVDVYTKDKNDAYGGDVLDVPHHWEVAGERQKVANVALAKVVKKDRVTIRWDMPTASPNEPPLAAYLRSFAEQTGLTVLGRFPDPKAQAADKEGKAAARLYNRRMSNSIVNKPLAEALNMLCSTYQSFWILDKPINPEAGVTVPSDVPQGTASKKDSGLPNKKRGHIIRFWAYVVTPPTR